MQIFIFNQVLSGWTRTITFRTHFQGCLVSSELTLLISNYLLRTVKVVPLLISNMDTISVTVMRSLFFMTLHILLTSFSQTILFLPGFSSSNTESLTFKNHLCHLYCYLKKRSTRVWHFCVLPSTTQSYSQSLHSHVDHRHIFFSLFNNTCRLSLIFINGSTY